MLYLRHVFLNMQVKSGNRLHMVLLNAVMAYVISISYNKPRLTVDSVLLRLSSVTLTQA